MRTSLSPASATIDAGRLLTLERRRQFAGLSLQIVDTVTGVDRIIDSLARPDSAGVLSERAIAHALISLPGIWYSLPGEPKNRAAGILAGRIAANVHIAMRDWSNAGYPRMDEGEIEVWVFQSVSIRAILRHAL